MTKQSREFEKLVARIEKNLLNTKAVVKSPDYIKDKVSGQMREVDASIGINAGSSYILITLECRDRKSKSLEDVTWIEQLAKKKQNLGINQTIAVTSTRFSKPAQAVAKAEGIELRKISELNSKDFSKWLNATVINVRGEIWSIKGLRLETFELDADEIMGKGYSEALEKDKYNAPAVFDMKDKAYSITDLLIMWEKESGLSFIPTNNIPQDKEYVYGIEQSIDRGVFYVPTNKGKQGVSKFTIILEASKINKLQPINKFLGYEDENGVTSEIAQASLYGNYNVEIHRNTKSGQIKLNVYNQES